MEEEHNSKHELSIIISNVLMKILSSIFYVLTKNDRSISRSLQTTGKVKITSMFSPLKEAHY